MSFRAAWILARLLEGGDTIRDVVWLELQLQAIEAQAVSRSPLVAKAMRRLYLGHAAGHHVYETESRAIVAEYNKLC